MSRYLNDIKEEDLALIRELAAVFFTEEEVAMFMKIPWAHFKESVKDPNHKIHDAYYSGFRQAEFDLRKIIMRLAIAGSTPAQTAIMEIHKKAFTNRMRP
jgi:hypothetical protein